MSNNPPVESQHTESKPPLSESLEEDPQDEEESFSTRQLFKFAWQIAKGMVATVFVYMLSYLTRELAFKNGRWFQRWTVWGIYIYWESRISLPKFTCPQENKSTKFSDKPLLSAKQPNLAKCHEMKSGGKIGKRRSFGILKATTRSANTLFYAHFGSLSSRFSSRVFYPRSSHIFIHLKIFPWCTLVTWSRLRKPRSKLRYLGVTFETLKIPGEPRNGGDCTMDNNLRGLRSNSTIVIQNIIGKMQLGRQTFRIKSY